MSNVDITQAIRLAKARRYYGHFVDVRIFPLFNCLSGPNYRVTGLLERVDYINGGIVLVKLDNLERRFLLRTDTFSITAGKDGMDSFTVLYENIGIGNSNDKEEAREVQSSGRSKEAQGRSYLDYERGVDTD